MRGGDHIGTDGAPHLLSWCDTTIGLPYETGIQRVTRRLAAALERRGITVMPVGWDARHRVMRALTTGAVAASIDEAPTGSSDRWLLVPEIPMSALVQDLDPAQISRAYERRVAAIVHDLIPIRRAADYDAHTVGLHRRYFRMFADADLTIATTDLVAGHLREYLRAEGLREPEIAVVPLAAQFADLPRVRTRGPVRGPDEPLRLLAVSTWEPRKNYPLLLRAVRRAQAHSGRAIHLTIVGRRGCFPAYDAEVDVLLDGMGEVAVLDRAGDRELAELYRTHHASVYPSVEEGFGMPILESLWLGRPCLCHTGSSMAEVAPGGGTLMVDMADEDAVAMGLIALMSDAGLLDRLTGEALARPLRDWDAYAADVARRLRLSAQIGGSA